MPIKRRLSKVRQHRITPELVDLWVCLREIQEVGDDEEWEPEGRRREYLDNSRALDSGLGLRPWEASPLHVHEGKPPPPYQNLYAASWPRAQELRRELETALKAGLRLRSDHSSDGYDAS